MKTNVGKIDRIIRIIIGIGLLSMGGCANWIPFIVGLIILFTGIFGYCGIYALLKTSTCKSCEMKE